MLQHTTKTSHSLAGIFKHQFDEIIPVFMTMTYVYLLTVAECHRQDSVSRVVLS